MKCTHESDMPKVLAISQIVYQPSRSIISLIFDTLALFITVTSRPDIVASLTDSVPVRNFFLLLQTVSKIPIRPIIFSQFSENLRCARFPMSCGLLQTLRWTNRYWLWKFSVVLGLDSRWCETIGLYAICWAMIRYGR